MLPSDVYTRAALDHVGACTRCLHATHPERPRGTICPVGRVLRDLRAAWHRLEAAERQGRKIAQESTLNA